MTKRFDSDDTTAPFAEAPAAKKTVEKWAEAKGMWPQVLPSPQRAIPAGTPAGSMGTVPIAMASLTGPLHNPEFWRFAAAKAMHGWPEGRELTETDFDAAVKAATEATGR